MTPAMKISANKVTSNLIWRLLERFSAQGVTFVVSIILARLLDPVVYGTIAIVTIFTTILQVFVDSGLGNALIQKKNADDVDFSSVFYFNIGMCTVLYLGVFFAAPLIALFYENAALVPIIRVLSLTLIISGIKNVQQAFISRNMMFKRFFLATTIGTICSAAVGITMAFNGFGVWSLVAQTLCSQSISTLTLWVTVKWRPKWLFSFQRLKGLFSFGWKLLVSNLINTVYNDLRQLLIGKVYTPQDLAFYNKGHQFPQLIVNNINSSIDSVLLPAMSSEQDDKTRVKMMTRRAIKVSTYIIMPIMMGLAVCAEPFIRLLLTDKWLPCVPFLRIFCFTMAFYPVQTANLNAIKAMGRSDLFLKLEIIKKVIGLTVLFSTMWISVEAMAYSLLFTSLLSSFINAFPNRKLLNYKYEEQLLDILPTILLTCGMGAIVFCITLLRLSNTITLLIQIPLGIAVYILGSIVFRSDSYTYVLNILKSSLKRRKKYEFIQRQDLNDHGRYR